MKARNAMFKQLTVSTVLFSVMMAVFFLSASRIDIPRAWLFFIVTFLHFALSTLALYRFSPELLIRRLQVKREGSKGWDEVLMRLVNLMLILVVPIVAGLDIGRFMWSELGMFFVVPGLISLVASSVLMNWAMIENPHFEPTVRIQEDREHIVVTTGPYAFLRHPGYLSGILYTISIPLMIGSLYTFIPVALYVLLIILRTQLEDSTLQKELAGYSEYTEKVRYRLFPGIW